MVNARSSIYYTGVTQPNMSAYISLSKYLASNPNLSSPCYKGRGMNGTHRGETSVLHKILKPKPILAARTSNSNHAGWFGAFYPGKPVFETRYTVMDANSSKR
jgi:hypothetical protein